MLVKDKETERLRTEVLVIGGGIAGCLAAIRARELGCDVTLVEKANIGRGGYSHQMSGVLTYFEPSRDDLDGWYAECVRAGQGMVDQERLAGMVEETTARARDMVAWGVLFQRQHEEFIRNPGVGHKLGRNLLLENGGFQMMSAIRGEVLRREVRCIERVHISDLFSSDGCYPTKGRVTGALGFQVRRGRVYVLQAKAVVLATGATDLWYLHAPSLSGDGRVMAYRLGAAMRNVELAYNTPKPLHFDTAPGANELFGEGAYMVNRQGERFLAAWDAERIERAPRVVVGRAINDEYFHGRGPVYLDARHLSEEAHGRLEKTLPILINSFAKAGLSLRRDLIEYTAVISDLGAGGLRVDPVGATTVEGLYAAGAVSDHGEDGVTNIITHGMEAAIGGWRAGEAAARDAGASDFTELRTSDEEEFRARLRAPFERPDKLTDRDLLKVFRDVEDLAGVRRSQAKLEEALEMVEMARGELLPALRPRDYHHLSVVLGYEHTLFFVEMLARTALVRTESRGGHFRSDYPQRDDANWLKWLIVKPGKKGMEINAEPVPAGRYDRAVA